MAAFPDRVAQGFLQVDIFPRLAGGDGDEGMPVGLGGDDHGVDRPVVEELPVIVVGRDPIAAGFLPARARCVAWTSQTAVTRTPGSLRKLGMTWSAPGSAADEGQVDRVVGTGCCPGMGRRGGSGDGRGRGPEELSPGRLTSHRSSSSIERRFTVAGTEAVGVVS